MVTLLLKKCLFQCVPGAGGWMGGWMLVDLGAGAALGGSIRTARAPRVHRARTASAPRQVFEQLLQEMVYGERSCRWYLLGSEALPFPLIGSG